MYFLRLDLKEGRHGREFTTSLSKLFHVSSRVSFCHSPFSQFQHDAHFPRLDFHLSPESGLCSSRTAAGNRAYRFPDIAGDPSYDDNANVALTDTTSLQRPRRLPKAGWSLDPLLYLLISIVEIKMAI